MRPLLCRLLQSPQAIFSGSRYQLNPWRKPTQEGMGHFEPLPDQGEKLQSNKSL